MKSFSIVAKTDDNSKKLESYIQAKLEENAFRQNKEQPEIVICIGGDGTLLYAVHKYVHLLHSIKFVAIHTGTLGFFTDYVEDEVDKMIQDIVSNQPLEVFVSRLLEIQVDQSQPYYALNEVRIENIRKTQKLDIYIDDEFFEKVVGNGVCVSTQAGSTAFNRSIKGAVIDSGLEVMQLCEIAGIQNAKHKSLGSPYIMNNDREIRFTCEDSSGAFLCYDHLYFELQNAKTITCKVSEKCVSFVRFKSYSYLERLRSLY